MSTDLLVLVRAYLIRSLLNDHSGYRRTPMKGRVTTAMVLQTARLYGTARTSNTPSLVQRLAATMIFSCVSLACGESGPTAPSRGVLVTFRVADETFRVHLLDDKQVVAAHQAANGGRARIPSGRVVAGTSVNVGWSWHLEDVEFAELTTEVCDGRPSDVEREGVSFGGGRFCPWTARVISIGED